MPRPAPRQPRPISRTVLSVSLPVLDHQAADAAAHAERVSLSAFVRAAIRERAARVLGCSAEPSPLSDAA